MTGDGVYLRAGNYLFLYSCDESSCQWTTIKEGLEKFGFGVMMPLPLGYACTTTTTTASTTKTTTTTTTNGNSWSFVHRQIVSSKYTSKNVSENLSNQNKLFL